MTTWPPRLFPPAFGGRICEALPVKQTERIIRHLQDYGSITSLEAMEEYGIMRLASRVSDLRKAGMPIRAEMVSGKNRYGEATNYARYYLELKGGV